MRRLHPKDRRLNGVETKVSADPRVHVLRLRAVVAEQPDLVGERGVIRRHQTAVAEAAQILRREERKTSCRAKSTGQLPVIPRADRLGGVLDHRDARLARQLQDRVHVGGEPVEMDRHNRARSRRNRARHSRDLQIECHRIDVHEDRRGADSVHRPGRREKRKRRHDDFRAGPDAKRHERNDQCVGARGHADGVTYFEPLGELAFERLDLGSEDEALTVGDARERLDDLVADRRVLRREVEQGDRGVARLCHGHAGGAGLANDDAGLAPDRQIAVHVPAGEGLQEQVHGLTGKLRQVNLEIIPPAVAQDPRTDRSPCAAPRHRSSRCGTRRRRPQSSILLPSNRH